MTTASAGQLLYFRSAADGALHPCAVAETGPADKPRPLIVEVSPGALGDLQGCVRTAERMAAAAAELGEPCVALRATGRGDGSVYQNYGEVDVLEAIAHVRSLYDIDADRILVTGGSMGGAATWYLTSHYPDLFAGGAPVCGYCDYRLWEKPGGLTYHMHPWEEPSWQARSAAFLLDNFEHTPMFISHGEWDRAVGGGVPAAHSANMARALSERGFAHVYNPVPERGHDCWSNELKEAMFGWMLKQRKERDPDRIRLAVPWLRHRRQAWVAAEELAVYGQAGRIDAQRDTETIQVTTEGIQALSLGPAPSGGAFALAIDGDALGEIDLSRFNRFARLDGTWRAAAPQPGRKRPGVSGPISDLFFAGTLLVTGTAGTAEETFFNQMVAEHAPWFFRGRNGGVHRGGIGGQNAAALPVRKDGELTEDERARNNLLLYGTPSTNSVFARYADALPVQVGADSITLGGRTWKRPGVAAVAAFPHPENAERYVAVHTGTTPDAITWGSHLDMQLLPDYLVYAGGELLDWGFFDGNWRAR